MEIEKAKAIMEAVLFAAGRKVSKRELAICLEVEPEDVVTIAESMKADYVANARGIELISIEDGYQLWSKKEYYEYIVKLVEPKEQNNLSNAAMETLSIVAYNQPVTRSSIEFIRGVNSDSAVNKLVQRGLIEECGRLDTPGKPLLYKTTAGFLKTFGLRQINDLPDIDNVPLQLTFYDMKEED